MLTEDQRNGSGDFVFGDVEEEIEVARLPVEGKIPGWLSGDLIRNGPARWKVGKREFRHWFDGLAMLQRFGFEDGGVSYANKFLESAQYLHVREKGEIAYGEFATDPCRSIFKRFTSVFSPPELGNNANVNVHKIAGRFVALTETPLPVEFDPETLRTVGVFEYEDAVRGFINTPHPHTDPATGDALNNITNFSRQSSYNVFRVPKGTRRREVIVSLPVDEPAYMHSFGQTERYAVLSEYPLVTNPLKMLLSGRSFAENLEWKPDRPARFLVVDKRSGELASSQEAAPFFSFHHVNAFEKDGEVIVDLLAYPDASIVEKLYMDVLRNPGKGVTPPPMAELRRYRLDLAGGDAEYEVLSEEGMELPRINEARMAGEYSYVYGAGQNRENPGGYTDQLVKADVGERTSKVWSEEGCHPGEPIFVAAPGARKEDEGLVLSVVLDANAGDSFLLALDAGSFAEVARARVSHHVPTGFHGKYFGGDA